MSSHFKKWAESHQILIQYIQPGKPAQNGFIERFNRTYREEVLDSYLFDSLQEAEQITRQWIEKYNRERPHESLADQSLIDFAEARKIKGSINYVAAINKEYVLNYSTFDLS